MSDNTENQSSSYDPNRVTHIRPERPAEVGVINALVMQAFADNPGGDGHQSFMVEKLRDAGQLTFSFVSINEGRPVGHVSVLPVTVTTDQGKTEISDVYAIGPVAVLPDLQDAGQGAALVNHAVGALHGLGAKAVVAYGYEDFFSRFGFTQAEGLEFPAGDSAKLQILNLTEDELTSGTVKYPEEFEAAL